jgi:outer membrane protein
MKKSLLVLASLALTMILTIPVAVWSADKKDGGAGVLKIGVIDMQRIMRDSKAVKKVRDAFQQDVQAKRATLTAKEKEVKLLDEELKGSAPKLSPEALKEKSEKLAREGKELARFRDDLTEELKKSNNELTRKVIGEIVGIAKSLSRKEHYAVILEKNAVVTSDEAIDLTDKIIKFYDEGK